MPIQQMFLGIPAPASAGSSGGSVIFDGDDWLSLAASSDLDLDGDFTIEGWVLVDVDNWDTNYGRQAFFGNNIAWATNHAAILLSNSGQSIDQNTITLWSDTSRIASSQPTTVRPSDGWTHIAITRSGSGVRIFKNGNFLVGVSSSTTFKFGTSETRIGNTYVGSTEEGLNGKISNLRVIKGTALWTNSFALTALPLTTTSQGATASNVKLLCCNDPEDATGSTVTPQTITAVGDPQPSSESPFETNNGVWIDRSDNQYMYTLNNSAIQFGTGDFTIECWFNWHSNNNDWQSIFGKYSASGGAASDNGWWIHLSNSGILNGGDRGNGFATGSTVLSLNTWYHVALVRSGTTVSIYLNGVLEATHTSDDGGGVPRNCDNNTEFHIGHLANYGRGWDGYISNMRLVKGQALYTSNFTPPTEPLTLTSQGAVESNVGFLGCQTPIVSAVSKGPKAHTNSYVKPSYGPFSGSSGFGSVDLDGTNDFVEVAAVSGSNPPWSFGSNDAFTIECWAFADSYANTGWYKRIWSLSDNPAVNNYTDGITMEMDNNGAFRFRYDNSILLSSNNRSASTWYHVAFTRMEEGTIVLHVDGQAQASSSNPGVMDYGPHSVKIGEHHGLNESGWNGKISNFHLHKGAKYSTSDFTKPTSPVGPSANTIILCCTDPSNATASLKNPSTITTSGNASASSSHPF